jgi:hypothetical protein
MKFGEKPVKKKIFLILVTTAVLGAFGFEAKDRIIENELKNVISQFEKDLKQNPEFDKITYSDVSCGGFITVNCEVKNLALISKVKLKNSKTGEVEQINIDSIKMTNVQNLYFIDQNQNGTYPGVLEIKKFNPNFVLDDENPAIYPFDAKLNAEITINNNPKIEKFNTVINIKKLDFVSKIMNIDGSYKVDLDIPFSDIKDGNIEYLMGGADGVLPNLADIKANIEVKEIIADDQDIKNLEPFMPINLVIDSNFVKNIIDTKKQNGTGESVINAIKISNKVFDLSLSGKITTFIQNGSISQENLIPNKISLSLTDKDIFNFALKEIHMLRGQSKDTLKHMLLSEVNALQPMLGSSEKLKTDLIQNLSNFIKDDNKKNISISLNNKSAQDVEQLSQMVFMSMMMGNMQKVEEILYNNLGLNISVK